MKKIINLKYLVMMALMALTLIPMNVNAGLNIGSGCYSSPYGGHICPNMNYDGKTAYCIDPNRDAVEGSSCSATADVYGYTGDNNIACIWYANKDGGYAAIQNGFKNPVGYAGNCVTKTGNCNPATLTMGLANENLSLSGSYFKSQAISVTIGNAAVTSGQWRYSLSGTYPTGTQLVDGSDTVIPTGTLTSVQPVYIRIPSANVTSTINMTVGASIAWATTNCVESTPVITACIMTSSQSVAFDGRTEDIPKNTDGNASDSKNVKLSAGQIIVDKKDSESGNPISGIEFDLCLDAACNNYARKITGELVGKLITDDSGIATATSLPYGTYYLVETKGKDTHILITTPIEVILNSNSKTVEVTNKEIEVDFSKVDITGENELPGATIIIYDSTGTVEIARWTSDGTPKRVKLAAGTYILKETVAPFGYVKVLNSLTFSIDNYGKVTLIDNESDFYHQEGEHIFIVNDYTHVIIEKKDGKTGDVLPGATLRLVCSNQLDETWVSDGTPMRFNLEPGVKCTLEELSAPKKYDKLTAKAVFVMQNDGTIKFVGKTDVHYTKDGNLLTVYNGEVEINVPDTGASLWIGAIIVGVSSISGGCLILKKKKEA